MAAAAGLPNSRVVVVDPSAAMLAGACEGVRTECLDAGEWADDDSQRFGGVLLKEVVHHLGEPEARGRVFAALARNRVAAGGALLVVTRPSEPIDYPMWPAAKAVWAANQPSASTLADELTSAGLLVETSLARYPLEMPTSTWTAMVRGRFWSTFSHFTDEELETVFPAEPAREICLGDSRAFSLSFF